MNSRKIWSKIILNILTLNLIAAAVMVNPAAAQLLPPPGGGGGCEGPGCSPGGGGGATPTPGPACTYTMYPTEATKFSTIAAAGQHSMAIDTNGSVWVWGRNQSSIIADHTVWSTTNDPLPINGITNAVTIAPANSDYAFSYVGQSDGLVQAFKGSNTDNNMYAISVPYDNPGDYMTSIISSNSDNPKATAVDNEGNVWEWTETFNPSNPFTTPAKKSIPSPVTAIATGYNHTLALTSNGNIWAWGNNNFGQVGDGIGGNGIITDPIQVVDPTDPSGFLNGVSSIATSRDGSFAVKTDGTVWSWGQNYYGELGDAAGSATLISGPTPTQINNLSGITSMAAGDYHSLFITASGTVQALGLNDRGQLGDGTGGDATLDHNSSEPVDVAGISGISKVAGGQFHSLALNSDQTIYGWGLNSSGQVGDGGTDSTNGPLLDHLDCSITPVEGPIAGHTAVTISGENFDSDTSITFGSDADEVPATDLVVGDSHTLTAQTPAHAAGPVNVNIYSDGVYLSSINSGFYYIGPSRGGGEEGDANGNLNIGCDTSSGALSLQTPSAVSFESRSTDFYNETDASALHTSNIPDDIARIRILDTRGFDPQHPRGPSHCGDGFTFQVQSSGLRQYNTDGKDFNLQLGLGTINNSILTEDTSITTSNPDILVDPTDAGGIVHAVSASSDTLVTGSADLIRSDEAFNGNIDFYLDNNLLLVRHDKIQRRDTVSNPTTVPFVTGGDTSQDYIGPIPTGTYSGTITFTLS